VVLFLHVTQYLQLLLPVESASAMFVTEGLSLRFNRSDLKPCPRVSQVSAAPSAA
jgi:hypothetical protein